MGTYLNPSNQNFIKTISSEIYVDKTDMILELNSLVNTEQSYVCISRPRRFGKSVAANMIGAYYQKGADVTIFQNSKLIMTQDWDKYLGKFDVIKLVMTDFIKNGVKIEDSLKTIRRRILGELDEEYPGVKYEEDDLSYSMTKFYQKSKRQFVIIIDEWDAVFRENKDNNEDQVAYLDFLRDWLKNQDFLALAYMTGILPIKKYGKHSALNMFDEYSIVSPMQFAKYTGFTEQEVKDLCEKYKMSFEDISDWYDGYTVNDVIPVEMREKYRKGEYNAQVISIYSPLSVVKAMTTGHIQNYWNKTETYEALAEYIKMNLDGLKDSVALMIDGGSVKVDISTYQNDMTTFTCRDDVLALLINLGYLKYDMASGTVSVPNREIMEEFRSSTKSKEWVETFKSFHISCDLLDAIWAGDSEKTASLIELAHDRTGNKTYNNEAALSYAIQYALYAAQKYYTIIHELDTGKGYADLAYLPAPEHADKPALVVELKYDCDVQTGLDQIKKRNYPQILEHYKGNMLLVSINYDKDLGASNEKFKHHSCYIEKVVV